jgi:[protein-PII] uridylyltransferase
VTANFQAARSELIRRPGPFGPGRRHALTALTDDWLRDLFMGAEATADADIALVAVGGHGRSELAPGSDLDLLLLHRTDPRRAATVADALWYPIWDSGVSLDHSVRTVAEARRLASEDVKVVLGLMDARVIAGPPELAEQLKKAVFSDWRAMASRRLPDLRELVDSRRERFGELAHVLEPDLKEAYGGLREATVIRAIAASWLTDIPHSSWQSSIEFLLNVRDALHWVSGKSGDVLLLQEQAAVAEALGLESDDHLLREVYAAGRSIAYASDTTWHRVTRLTRRAPRLSFRPGKRSGGPERLPLADGVVVQDSEVVLSADARPDRDPTLVLRAAAAAAQAGVPLAQHTVDRLARESAPIPVPWPRSGREAFISLLGAGAQTITVWEALDQVGLISSLIPGWEVVRSAPQRNAIHRFTVDRHLVETAVQASALTRSVERPDLLLVAALLHDIGKGRPGDHSVVGAEIAGQLCPMLGFDAEDTATIVALVRYHLILPDTATRRDLDDPATIAAVTDVLNSHELLDLMNALVEADSMATGPAAWSDWRRNLIHELVKRSHAALAGTPHPEPPALTPEQLALAGMSGVQVTMTELDDECILTVSAPDRVGLLSLVAGVLSLHRLQVRAAKVTTVADRALQVWTVRPLYGDPPRVEQVADDLKRALDGTYDIAEKIAKRDAAYASSDKVAHPQARVDIAAGVSESTTVLEVRSHDAPGLLHRVTGAVASADAAIVGAKVATLGSEVVDVFFLVDPLGEPLTADHAAAVKVTVQAALA